METTQQEEILVLRIWKRARNILIKKKVTVVLRYDDFSSLSNHEVEERIVDLCQKNGISVTFGVVPFITTGDVHLPESAETIPLEEGKAKQLRCWHSAGVVDIALHGYSHQTSQVDPPSEFAGLSLETQFTKIKEGKIFLEEMTGIKVTTFIPPWNAYDQNTLQSLEVLGFNAISAKRSGPASIRSRLKFLPETCSIKRLPSAVKTARSCSQRHPIIVLVFHAFEFVEGDVNRGSITFENFSTHISWLKQQPDIRLCSIEQVLKRFPGLTAKRFLSQSDFSSGIYR
jgi:peptidoglycan/xylan/chitin deacetylase (PgdA/CDA1 family)